MKPSTGRAIGLAFAALWLLLGAAALPTPWHQIIGVSGLIAIVALALRAWRMKERVTGAFRMSRYWIAVAAECVALVLANVLLNRNGQGGYLLPVVAMIVGLHFVGLWWAGGGPQYLWLAGIMTPIGAAALLLPPGSPLMQAVTGLGSAAALAGIAGTGARR